MSRTPPGWVLTSWFLMISAVGAQGDLEIVFVDVGQGDSTLLISPDGTTLLMDAGDNGQGTAAVLPALQARGITTLDYFVASHYHADHIGGVDELVDNGIDILVAYDRGGSFGTASYADYVAAVGAARTTILVGEEIDLGGGVTARCVSVNGQVLGGAEIPVTGTSQEENARSVALLIEMGEFELFVGGDLTGGGFSTADVETPVGRVVGDVEVLRLNHHGSNTSSHGVLLGHLKPNVAVISLGDGNPFGFPHAETITRVTSLPMLERIYQTRSGTGATAPEVVVANGDITLVTGGQDYTLFADTLPVESYPVNVNPGDLVINEIMKNPSQVSDGNGEWFELYNRGPTPVDVSGWRIFDDDFDFHLLNGPGDFVIGPGEYFVLGVDGNPASNGGYSPDYVYDDFLLGNGDDEINIGYLSAGEIIEIDRIRYDDLDFPDTPGRSMELVDLLAEVNDVGGLWGDAQETFGDGDFGSPGLLNSIADPLDGVFVRGDANGDGILGLPDPIGTLGYLFGGDPLPLCLDAHDANDNGTVGLDDAIYSLSFQFADGAPPPAPYPGAGPDPTPDPLTCGN